jgi:hypothetical protein
MPCLGKGEQNTYTDGYRKLSVPTVPSALWELRLNMNNIFSTCQAPEMTKSNTRSEGQCSRRLSASAVLGQPRIGQQITCSLVTGGGGQEDWPGLGEVGLNFLTVG